MLEEMAKEKVDGIKMKNKGSVYPSGEKNGVVEKFLTLGLRTCVPCYRFEQDDWGKCPYLLGY